MSAWKSAPNKPKKARICNETRFVTKARILNKTLFVTKTRICRIAAWTCNNWHDPCNTIYAENHAYDHNKIVNIELNSKYFNVAESACLQCMSSASDWSNSTCQPFLTSNWHFWQMVQMSAQCLLCKTEKAQISGQMQIICTGWQHCRQYGGQMGGVRWVWEQNNMPGGPSFQVHKFPGGPSS